MPSHRRGRGIAYETLWAGGSIVQIALVRAPEAGVCPPEPLPLRGGSSNVSYSRTTGASAGTRGRCRYGCPCSPDLGSCEGRVRPGAKPHVGGSDHRRLWESVRSPHEL